MLLMQLDRELLLIHSATVYCVSKTYWERVGKHFTNQGLVHRQEQEGVFIECFKGEHSTVVLLWPPESVGASEVALAVESHSYLIWLSQHQVLSVLYKRQKCYGWFVFNNVYSIYPYYCNHQGPKTYSMSIRLEGFKPHSPFIAGATTLIMRKVPQSNVLAIYCEGV